MDLLRSEAVAHAEELLQDGWDVHFKFTCEQCGERCILSDANTLYEYGECYKCGHETKLKILGFLTIRRLR